ncbi:hypothetical protein PENTCL1PPCAC_14974, partial [Pristionchus entomophagus]
IPFLSTPIAHFIFLLLFTAAATFLCTSSEVSVDSSLSLFHTFHASGSPLKKDPHPTRFVSSPTLNSASETSPVYSCLMYSTSAVVFLVGVAVSLDRSSPPIRRKIDPYSDENQLARPLAMLRPNTSVSGNASFFSIATSFPLPPNPPSSSQPNPVSSSLNESPPASITVSTDESELRSSSKYCMSSSSAGTIIAAKSTVCGRAE